MCASSESGSHCKCLFISGTGNGSHFNICKPIQRARANEMPAIKLNCYAKLQHNEITHNADNPECTYVLSAGVCICMCTFNIWTCEREREREQWNNMCSKNPNRTCHNLVDLFYQFTKMERALLTRPAEKRLKHTYTHINSVGTMRSFSQLKSLNIEIYSFVMPVQLFVVATTRTQNNNKSAQLNTF